MRQGTVRTLAAAVVCGACVTNIGAPSVRRSEAPRAERQDNPFDRYLAECETSGDPIAVKTAAMLRSMTEQAARQSACGGRDDPLDVATYAGDGALANAVANVLEVGLTRHTGFRVTRLRDAEALDGILAQLHDGRWNEGSLPDVGRWANPTAIALVRAQPAGRTRIVITVRLTCLEEGVDIAAAQAVFDADFLPEPTTPRCEDIVAAGNTRDLICCMHPNLRSCRR